MPCSAEPENCRSSCGSLSISTLARLPNSPIRPPGAVRWQHAPGALAEAQSSAIGGRPACSYPRRQRMARRRLPKRRRGRDGGDHVVRRQEFVEHPHDWTPPDMPMSSTTVDFCVLTGEPAGPPRVPPESLAKEMAKAPGLCRGRQQSDARPADGADLSGLQRRSWPDGPAGSHSYGRLPAGGLKLQYLPALDLRSVDLGLARFNRADGVSGNAN